MESEERIMVTFNSGNEHILLYCIQFLVIHVWFTNFVDYSSLCQSLYIHLSHLLPSSVHMRPGDPKIMFTINLFQTQLAKQTWCYGSGLLIKDPFTSLEIKSDVTFSLESEKSEWELNLVNEDTGQLTFFACCLLAKLNWSRYNRSTPLSVIYRQDSVLLGWWKIERSPPKAGKGLHSESLTRVDELQTVKKEIIGICSRQSGYKYFTVEIWAPHFSGL